MGMITYIPDIPDGPHNPSDDQPDMKTNTNNINAIIGVDHVPFNVNQSGYHKVIRFQNQLANPTPNGFGQLYTRTRNSDNQLFYETSSGTVFQITSTPSAITDGYTFLPGGILMQWGIVPFPGGSGGVTFNIPFPSGNPPFVIQLTVLSSSDNRPCSVNNSILPSSTSFGYLINTSGSGVSGLYWFAIGN